MYETIDGATRHTADAGTFICLYQGPEYVVINTCNMLGILLPILEYLSYFLSHFQAVFSIIVICRNIRTRRLTALLPLK